MPSRRSLTRTWRPLEKPQQRPKCKWPARPTPLQPEQEGIAGEQQQRATQTQQAASSQAMGDFVGALVQGAACGGVDIPRQSRTSRRCRDGRGNKRRRQSERHRRAVLMASYP
jgi:hypothetical protein